MFALIAIVPFLYGVMASYDPYLDQVEMYRLQPIENLFDSYIRDSHLLNSRGMNEDTYFTEVNTESNGKASVYDDSPHSVAHQRDQEHIEHSDLHGFQSVSGGTVVGASNNKEVKSDKQLPAYCNPPNPCPVGMKVTENCVENFKNTAENNQKLLSQQICSCDTEHMFSCPSGSQTVSTKTQGDIKQMALNKVIDELSKLENQENNMENNPDVSVSQKRLTVVAKKSPHVVFKRSENTEHGNPYLQGERIDIAAKKDPYMAQNSMTNLNLD
uniref:Neuroendocrine protein 7B2 n=1 Tax=Arion vulgaris TaxID=1028688 RepID=A0A0B6Y076_9EUPU